jgi:hypothetical protein
VLALAGDLREDLQDTAPRDVEVNYGHSDGQVDTAAGKGLAAGFVRGICPHPALPVRQAQTGSTHCKRLLFR